MGHDDHNVSYLKTDNTVWGWLTTVDHKKIGLMYMVSVLTFFFIGGMFALGLRYELFDHGPGFLSNGNNYNKAMTYHGAIMVFMVIIPGIPAFLGNFFLPIMIGAKDVAFPKINLLSYYVFMLGALIAVASLLTQGVDTGWTFYTPYSTDKAMNGTLFVVTGAFIMGMSSILTGLNFIVTVHKLRCKGMTMFTMPLFVWALYSTAIIQILATPVLAITLVLLIVERTMGIGVFDPKIGGDPILFQHFFWFYSHPAVYIMVLPGMGIISEIITTFSRKVIFGYKAIAFSSLGIGAVGFFVWGHHLFLSGQSEWAGLAFSFITMLVGVPTAIKTFNWVATMYKGSIRFDAPMLFAIGFLYLFTIGGVTGIMCATIGADVQFHDTYFVVAHFHYVMVGGTLMALMGGLYYWFPKMFGKMTSDVGGRWSWVFIFSGFNVTFFPQFILGTMGMPRRYFLYLPEFENLNRISTVGSWMIGVGFLIGLATLIHGWLRGEKAPNNPWGAKSLEWQTTSPPSFHNFDKDPVVTGGPYEYR